MATQLDIEHPAHHQGSGTDPTQTARARIWVLVPAKNEAKDLGRALDSVQSQVEVPGYDVTITVIDDASTDATAAIAHAHGTDVLATVDNVHRKAGALNQAWGAIHPHVGPDDLVLSMDADTVLDANFLVAATEHIQSTGASAVCGRFLADPVARRRSRSILGLLQAMEYHRYNTRTNAYLHVLSGTCSLIKVDALRQVERPDGTVWSCDSIVEDYELTVRMKQQNLEVDRVPDGWAWTDVMPTLQSLWRQRMRWQTGTIMTLVEAGKTAPRRDRMTRRGGHILLLVALLTWVAYAGLFKRVLDGDINPLNPWWLITAAIIVLRTRQVWSLGWAARIVAATLIFEELYNVLRAAWTVCSEFKAKWLRRGATRSISWS